MIRSNKECEYWPVTLGDVELNAGHPHSWPEMYLILFILTFFFFFKKKAFWHEIQDMAKGLWTPDLLQAGQ